MEGKTLSRISRKNGDSSCCEILHVIEGIKLQRKLTLKLRQLQMLGPIDQQVLLQLDITDPIRWEPPLQLHTRDVPFRHDARENAVIQAKAEQASKLELTDDKHSVKNVCSSSHADERSHMCSECTKAFSLQSALTIHMRTHTGEKPYFCGECDEMFARKSSLIRHMRTHTKAKPYTCRQCDKNFTQKNILTTHMRTHTGRNHTRAMSVTKGSQRTVP